MSRKNEVTTISVMNHADGETSVRIDDKYYENLTCASGKRLSGLINESEVVYTNFHLTGWIVDIKRK